MFYFQKGAVEHASVLDSGFTRSRSFIPVGGFSKRLFDCTLASLLLVPLVVFALALTALNPFLNVGPLIYRQKRMGYHCRPFIAYKFRSMMRENPTARGAFDALETDRITGLGRLIRRIRIDELPQIINVLRGDMSLIGPRPDSYAHARVYVRKVPGYVARHQVMPGISGFAQTEVGYVDGLAGIKRKVAADNYYIERATFGFDLWITWRTFCVVLGGRGA
jgi:lipopolysaccharide/colanic/teichoic acid biosynthesis glycosyltransferase